MESKESILIKLQSIKNNDYGAYQSIKGNYDFNDFILIIDQIPKDPYAPPHTGLYRIQIPLDFSGISINKEWKDLSRVAFCDFFSRRFYNYSYKIAGIKEGTGYSGIITIEKPGQAILKRSSTVLLEDLIEVRFFMGLPANGREINSPKAVNMFMEELPKIVEASFSKKKINRKELELHIKSAKDGDLLRSQLKTKDIIAFVANGSRLPRESGTSELPLNANETIIFKSPESMKTEMTLSNGDSITGMAIRKGITLIAGGGYHGKSTLLKAIEQGIYNHIPGDGRERVVTVRGAVKIRAYSGRPVEKVDISTFIKNLPFQKDTIKFSSKNASGSTSQAASIIEAIEAGAEILLMDEDTCATNFMIRDNKMQQLVHKNDEPITSYIDKARQIFQEKDISSILVLGGMGDYFNISDIVIQMREYRAIDVTDKARQICVDSRENRKIEDENYPICPKNRIPVPNSIDPFNEYNKRSTYAKEIHKIHFGKNEIDLTDLEQIMELSQTKAIMEALIYVEKYIDGKKGLINTINNVMSDLKREGFDVLGRKNSGNFAEFRAIDLASAINRIQNIQMVQK